MRRLLLTALGFTAIGLALIATTSARSMEAISEFQVSGAPRWVDRGSLDLSGTEAFGNQGIICRFGIDRRDQTTVSFYWSNRQPGSIALLVSRSSPTPPSMRIQWNSELAIEAFARDRLLVAHMTTSKAVQFFEQTVSLAFLGPTRITFDEGEQWEVTMAGFDEASARFARCILKHQPPIQQ